VGAVGQKDLPLPAGRGNGDEKDRNQQMEELLKLALTAK